ncbi:MAG: NAD-dependent epimerase/dehydratase family protein [Firmicutes bacterium]|nr:NAD-dependent epimerase/dehydratase family protein [Bacillota bacterium]
MRVLVTGAAGLYGLHTLEALASQQNILRVYGFDDFSRSFPREADYMACRWGEKIQLVKQRFQETTVKELNSLNIDVVIHLAGYNSGKESINTPEEYFLNNEYGTFQLMQTLMRTKNRPFLIYASTIEIYGEPVYTPLDENHPVNPQNVHAVTKLAAEKHVLAASKWCNYPVLALRFTNTYGENQDICGYTSVVSSFIDRALRKEPLIIYSSGDQTRDFLYVKDAAQALCMAVTRQTSLEGTVINVGTGKQTSICELAEKIKRLTGSTSEIIKLPCEKGEPHRTPISTGPAFKLLAWTPQHTLEKGLLNTISWHKSVRSI